MVLQPVSKQRNNNTSLRLRQYSLVVKVESDGKVLPHVLEDRGGPDLLVGAVEKLPCILGQVLADDGTSLKVELVARVVTCLMPDILLLNRQLCLFALSARIVSPGTHG